MISLKKVLQDDGAGEETLLRLVRLLLEGIERHAVEGDPDDLGGLRTSIQQLKNSLKGDLAVPDFPVQAGSVLQALDEYNRRTVRYLKRPAGEWQAVVTMLISAIAGMPAADGEKVVRLREIAGRVCVGQCTGRGPQDPELKLPSASRNCNWTHAARRSRIPVRRRRQTRSPGRRRTGTTR